MKRLHIVGKSKDNKKLYLARASDAKFGSMEIPIGRKLLGLIKEAEEAKRAKSGKPSPEEEAKEAKAAAKEAEGRAERSRKAAEEAEARAAEAAERLKEAERRAKQAEATAARSQGALEKASARSAKLQEELQAARARSEAKGAAEPGQDRSVTQGGLPEGSFERAMGMAELEGLHGVRAVIRRTEEGARDEIAPAPEPAAGPAAAGEPAAPEPGEPAAPEPETAEAAPERPRLEPMPDSRLSPAEIQTLLRAGRGVRAVAKQAEVPVEWVRRLAAPIEAERLGVVTQLFRSFQERARLGRSAMPVGPAIVENLRDKGVRFPDRVIEEGWSATRSDGRAWRVRFTYESRGRKQRADWRFDPQSRVVEAVNSLANELGYRSPEDSDGTTASAAAGIAAAMRPRAIRGRASGSEGAGRGAAKRSGARKPAAGAKRSGKASGARKKSATRKKSAARKKAGGKAAGSKKTGTRKKPGSKRSGRSRR